MSDERRLSWGEFWPFYLGEHRDRVNQILHAIGSLSGLTCLGFAIYLRNPWLILLGLVIGYGCAWVGHFVFEKNRPATFRYPLKSFCSDWRLLALVLSGRVGAAVQRLEPKQPAEPQPAPTAEPSGTPS
ncbi:MAG: DUF962 domain-containing protein [Planctomycetes bacterium]|nr:DUF962 domain-containing protein [Planctomycetota bacterium]